MTMKPLLVAALAALVTLPLARPVDAAPAPDARFRTFGPVNVGGTDFGYRWGSSEQAYAPGATFGADYISVGTLDGRGTGPYAGVDDTNLWKRWSFLRRKDTGALDGPIYRTIVRLLGAQAGQLYQEDVLAAQLAAERPHLAAVIAAFVRSQRTTAQGAPVNEPIVFEVGNEPNCYPYMDPDLYGWYYLTWRREILAAVAAFNVGRPAGQAVSASIMPAGLWMYEGLPDAVTRTLSLTIDVATLHLVRSVETSTRRYYDGFLAAIRAEKYAALGSGTYRTVTQSIRVPFVGTFSWKTQVFAPAAAADLVDVGNLHFYPYTHSYSAYGAGAMAPHLANLRDLAGYLAAQSKTGRVWLTEVGNVNPYDDARAAREVEEPLLAHLKAGGIPSISRWYWFKARGDDDKFRVLGGLQGGAGASLSSALAAVTWLNATRIVQVKTNLTAADFTVLDALTTDYRRQSPVQGLLDASGAVRSVGWTYARLAN